MNAIHKYPISEYAKETIQSITNKPLTEIQISNLSKNELVPDDLRIRAESLHAQANISRQAGYTRLAENLERAAELTRIPDEYLLLFYEALRPRRSTFIELEELARKLELEFNAYRCAMFIREGAEAYKLRGLLKID